MSAETLSVTFNAVSASRGEQVRARRIRLGMGVKPLAIRAGVDRGTLAALEAGDERVQEITFTKVQRALDELEEEMGIEGPSPVAIPDRDPASPGLIRFEVKGAYGFDAIVVEGPVENVDELVASVEKIMRGIRERDENNSQD